MRDKKAIKFANLSANFAPECSDIIERRQICSSAMSHLHSCQSIKLKARHWVDTWPALSCSNKRKKCIQHSEFSKWYFYT